MIRLFSSAKQSNYTIIFYAMHLHRRRLEVLLVVPNHTPRCRWGLRQRASTSAATTRGWCTFGRRILPGGGGLWGRPLRARCPSSPGHVRAVPPAVSPIYVSGNLILNTTCELNLPAEPPCQQKDEHQHRPVPSSAWPRASQSDDPCVCVPPAPAWHTWG